MTYDYVCTVCAHVWEAEQRITADPLKDCPNCHQMTAKRQISGGQGFILKGGGWYSDLYSSAKPEMAADSAKESKGSKESKDSKESTSESKSESKEPKSESKTESKTETKTEKAASPSASGAGGSTARPAASSTE